MDTKMIVTREVVTSRSTHKYCCDNNNIYMCTYVPGSSMNVCALSSVLARATRAARKIEKCPGDVASGHRADRDGWFGTWIKSSGNVS